MTGGDLQLVIHKRIGELGARSFGCEVDLDEQGEQRVTVSYTDDVVALSAVSFPSWRQGDRATNKLNVDVHVKLTPVFPSFLHVFCSRFLLILSGLPELQKPSRRPTVVLSMTGPLRGP